MLIGKYRPKDSCKCIQYLREAADDGIVAAQSKLAYFFWLGDHVAQDFDEAAVLAKKAADQGDAQAQCIYGLCLQDGYGIKRDEEQAFEYLLMAAKQGSSWAQRLVGLAFNDGTGVIEDSQKAFGWLKLSASNGGFVAMRLIAEHYADGHGTEKNPTESIKWFEKVCENGCDLAQYEYSRRLYFAVGIGEDWQKAYDYAKRSAMQGNAYAQRMLWYAYLTGRGVPRNRQQAYFWLTLALAQSNDADDATRLTILKQKLTPGQLADVEQETLKFIPKKESSR